MPIVSKAERRALHAKDPDLAAKFEAHTPKGKKLPERLHPLVKEAKRFHDRLHGKKR